MRFDDVADENREKTVSTEVGGSSMVGVVVSIVMLVEAETGMGVQLVVSIFV